MNATLLYRIAAVLFFLFGVGHLYGSLTFLPSTAEGRAVFQAMQDVHFTEKGASLSYGGFFRGFTISLGIQLFFSSYLAWHLGNVAKSAPETLGLIGWVFCAAQLVGLAFNYRLFAPPAIIPGLVLAVCLGWAAFLAGRNIAVHVSR
jgi:hypothetical protein